MKEDKIELTLVREKSEDYGTFGKITLPNGLTLETLELPWRDNIVRESCIPAKTYPCKVVKSARFGHVYGVCNVPNRTAILIHAGNYGGDVLKGYKSDIQGCILLGKSKGELSGQSVVLNSKVALKKFMDEMQNQDFELIIKNGNDN